MADGGFQDLPRRLASDKVLRGRTVNVAKNPKNNEYPRALASMVYKLFDKKKSKDASINHTGTRIVSDAFSENQQLAKH